MKCLDDKPLQFISFDALSIDKHTKPRCYHIISYIISCGLICLAGSTWVLFFVSLLFNGKNCYCHQKRRTISSLFLLYFQWFCENGVNPPGMIILYKMSKSLLWIREMQCCLGRKQKEIYVGDYKRDWYFSQKQKHKQKLRK